MFLYWNFRSMLGYNFLSVENSFLYFSLTILCIHYFLPRESSSIIGRDALAIHFRTWALCEWLINSGHLNIHAIKMLIRWLNNALLQELPETLT